MGEILLRSSHSWKSTALALALLQLLAFDLSPVWAEPQIADITPAVFLADPDQILLENPNGGPRLAADVRDLALSDPATLQSILGLLPKASKAQKVAIGAGLAEAARVSARSNPGYAKEIQQAVAQTKDADLIQAYDAATTGEYAGLTRGRTGLGSVSETGALESASPGTTFGIPPIFVPGNIASTTTTVPLTTAPVPGTTVGVPGVVTAVGVPGVVTAVAVPSAEVPSVAVPSAEVPSVEVPSVATPGVEVPSVAPPSAEVTAVALPNFFEVPSVAAPSAEVTAVALPNFFEVRGVVPTTPVSESVSPN
jgi:hypothetical protein